MPRRRDGIPPWDQQHTHRMQTAVTRGSCCTLAHQRFDHVHRRITVPLVVKETDEPATAEPAGGLPGSPAGPARCRDRRPGTRFRRRYTDGSAPDAADPRPWCRRDRTGRLREQRGQRADVQRGRHLWFGYLRVLRDPCDLRGKLAPSRQRDGQHRGGGSSCDGDPRRDGGALPRRWFELARRPRAERHRPQRHPVQLRRIQRHCRRCPDEPRTDHHGPGERRSAVRRGGGVRLALQPRGRVLDVLAGRRGPELTCGVSRSPTPTAW